LESGSKKKEVDKSLELVSSNIQDVQKMLSETRAEAAKQRDKQSRRNINCNILVLWHLER